MRGLIIKLLGTAISFYLTAMLIGGFRLTKSWETYFLASLVFLLLNFTIKPLLKLLFLPINLLTLGLFHWFINVIVLYLFDILYQGVTITAYDFPGYTSRLLSLPAGHISLFWTLVLSSVLISLFYSLYESVFKTD